MKYASFAKTGNFVTLLIGLATVLTPLTAQAQCPM